MSTPPTPYGSLPGEVDQTWVHISKKVWYRLHQDAKFKDIWNSGKPTSRYYLTLCCLFKSLADKQTITVVSIWSKKHGHAFDEGEFLAMGGDLWNARMYAGPKIMLHQARQYWEELRRISADPKARLNARLRVSYFLNNRQMATAREIHNGTGIALKTVQNNLGVLQTAGKVAEVAYGAYRVEKSEFWDRVWDDHPAMYGLVPCNEVLVVEGTCQMKCFNYCQGTYETVFYDDQSFFEGADHPSTCEWVIDEKGDAVENGTGANFYSSYRSSGRITHHKNGNRLDFRRSNLLGVKFKPRNVVSDYLPH